MASPASCGELAEKSSRWRLLVAGDNTTHNQAEELRQLVITIVVAVQVLLSCVVVHLTTVLLWAADSCVGNRSFCTLCWLWWGNGQNRSELVVKFIFGSILAQSSQFF